MQANKLVRLDAACCIVAAALAAWAVSRHPYAYYSILRWVVCGSSGYLAWRLFLSEMKPLAYAFGAIAVLFKPLIPFYLSRGTWAPIDVGTAIMLAIGAYLTYRLKPLT